MHGRKIVGPGMEPRGTPALTGYSCEDFSSRTTGSRLLLRKEEIKPHIWSEILKLVKKASMSKLVKSLGYIKCYSSSSPRSVESPSNSTRHNSQKICSWSRRPKTILEIRKKATFLWVIKKPIIYYKFFEDFTNHKEKINRVVIFSSRPFPNILKYKDHRWHLPAIWKTRLFSDIYQRVQLVCLKAKAHSFLEPPLEYNQEQTPLMNHGLLWPLQSSRELQIYYAVSD